jgi:hypothetical protein
VAASKVIVSTVALASPPCFGSQFPDESLALAVTRFVLEEKHVILGRRDAFAAVARGLVAVIDGQHRHHRGFRIRRQEAADVHHRAERDVPQVRRSPVVSDDPIRQQGEGMRRVAEVGALALHAKAAPAVRVIDEDEFAAKRERFFQGRKLPRLGAEDFGHLFRVLRSWFFAGWRRIDQEPTTEGDQEPRTKNGEQFHGRISISERSRASGSVLRCCR